MVQVDWAIGSTPVLELASDLSQNKLQYLTGTGTDRETNRRQTQTQRDRERERETVLLLPCVGPAPGCPGVSLKI